MDIYKSAKKELLNHKVVCFPTETVMGLGVVFDDFEAYNLLNKIKRRPEDKPYTMMLKNTSEIKKYARIDEKIENLINALMPGSITLLLKAKPGLPKWVTHGGDVVGVRVPTNIEAIKLLNEIDKPLLVPSANKSGEKPALNDLEARKIFNDEVSCYIDGESKGETPSTIISLIEDKPIIIRQGPIDLETIEKYYK